MNVVVAYTRQSAAPAAPAAGAAVQAVPAPPQASTGTAGANVTLSTAISAALAQNPAALAARQQLLQAQARADQARAQLRAPISFSSSAGISNAKVIQPPPSQETFGAFTNTLAVPLPLGRKPRLAVTQATLQVRAAQAAWDSARLALSTQVGAAFYDLLRKEALLAIAKDVRASAGRQLSDSRKRFAAGDVPELDVLRAQVPVAAADAGLYQAENDVTAARQALNAATGQPLDAPVEGEPLPDTPAQSPALSLTLDEARAKAVTNNPDVRSAEAAELAAEAGLKIAGLTREPAYAIQLSDTRSNDQTSFSRLDTLQATITIPLSDGGLAKAQQRESAAAREQARLQTESARRAAALAVSASYLSVQTSVRQIQSARIAVQTAQTAYDKTNAGYLAGLFPLTDVLSAQSALTQVRIALTQATYDAAVAKASLNNALGILP